MLTNDDKALVLLCSHIGINDKEIKPLTLKQWNELAYKIANSNIKRPEGLFSRNLDELMIELNLPKETIENIQKLLSRSVEISIELEALYSKGIKVVTRANNCYPTKLRKILKDLAPPVIFYAGNLSLANCDGIGIVGSRNIKEEYVEFTKSLVKKAIDEDLIIFSGGAKGIDDTSEKEAFIQGGRYVSFLADSLESRIKKKDIRDKISTGRILLMTATKPDIGFSVGAAMNRNKYIYGLSNAIFIIASDYNKGGTWTGASENIKNKWTKSFIRKDNKLKGNEELIKLGAIGIDNIKDISIRNLLYNEQKVIDNKEIIEEQLNLENLIKDSEVNESSESYLTSKSINIEMNKHIDFDLYYYIVDVIVNVLKYNEKNIDELSEILNVRKSQLGIWLKRAMDEGKIKKLNKPNRYIANNN